MKMFFKEISIIFKLFFLWGNVFSFFFLAAFLSGLKHLGWAGLGRGCHRPRHVITGQPPPPPAPLKRLVLVTVTAPCENEP